MAEYDIYLNGQGYMLAKDSKGGLVPGAAREQIVDPFTRQLSIDEPYTRVPFRFGDGAGLAEYDGSHRYAWGNGVDTRSGRLLMAPYSNMANLEGQGILAYLGGSLPSNIVAKSISDGGSIRGLAECFTVPTGKTKIRAVQILVKRDPDTDYTGAADFTVAIHPDDSGKPGTALGSATPSLIAEEDPWLPYPDRWRNGDFFWLEVVFSSGITVTPGNEYWISVVNDQTPILYWSENQALGAYNEQSYHNGSVWSTSYSAYPLFWHFGYGTDGVGENDSLARSFQIFRGSDNVERLYCGTGYRVMYYDEAAGEFKLSKDIGAPVLQLIEFNEKLFAACGTGSTIWYTDGASATTTWTEIAAQSADCFAIHDNMLWKPGGTSNVKGSEDGTTWTAGQVIVGDPGTRVMAMCSHGGKLFAAKPEGIFEISYPDTYPTSGTPTCNLMLDFSTERCSRPWMIDWHSGLYFPGLGGVYELKAGVLRNLWEDKVDEGALSSSAEGVFARPRSWAPRYDEGPAGWSSAHGTTRGLVLARCNPYLATPELLYYDGRNWHPINPPTHAAAYRTAVFVQDLGGGRGRLWTNEGVRLLHLNWPNWTDDFSQDGSVDPASDDVYCWLPTFSLPEQSRSFLLAKIGATIERLATGKVEVYYRLDDDTSWTDLGDLTTEPYQELSFPANTTARRVQFRLTLKSDYPYNDFPIVEQLDLFHQSLPEPSKTHQVIISCAPAQSLREGGVDERTAGEIVADIKALVGNTGFTYIDLLGVSHSVRATAITIQPMDQTAGPGPTGQGVVAQVIVNLLEV